MTTVKDVIRQAAQVSENIQFVMEFMEELEDNLPKELPCVIAHTDLTTGQRVTVKFPEDADAMSRYINAILQGK